MTLGPLLGRMVAALRPRSDAVRSTVRRVMSWATVGVLLIGAVLGAVLGFASTIAHDWWTRRDATKVAAYLVIDELREIRVEMLALAYERPLPRPLKHFVYALQQPAWAAYRGTLILSLHNNPVWEMLHEASEAIAGCRARLEVESFDTKFINEPLTYESPFVEAIRPVERAFIALLERYDPDTGELISSGGRTVA